jgi:hypothetical protein
MRLNSMSSRWTAVVAASLVAFAGLVIVWQLTHYDARENGPCGSVAQNFLRGENLAGISNSWDRSREHIQILGLDRRLDLMLPTNARVFMTYMTGPTNFAKVYFYYFAAYYLFPREIGVSVDQPARLTEWGFPGRAAGSDQEILTNGFDARLDFSRDGAHFRCIMLRDLPIRNPVNPAWFDSNFDRVMAFLLPLLTALAGMWLFRILFFPLSGRMPLLEQLACGLGLGMMAVAAITLGVKLCGFHGRGLILMATAVGGIAETWRNRKAYWTGIAGGFQKMIVNPIVAAPVVAAFFVFLILFRLAGLQDLLDDDAARWMLKAKIIHLYTGSEIVKWFSNPRLAHAHLDYPTLVPSLHSATYDSLGHVNDFVAKFWPAWMLLLLMAALSSLNRSGKKWYQTPLWALLGLLLLPAIQRYVQWEGSTLPLIFFTVLGFRQCALWLMKKDRARLGLGLTLLFGGAMTHFEGFILLALAGGWMLLLPSARPSLKLSPRVWRVWLFCFLAALPYLCLRVQIPSLHYESGWAGYALHHPGITLANWPGVFLIMVARLFVSRDFANWSGDDGRFHWIGKWDGGSSLYEHTTLGLAWLCLLMTIALWFALPARRQVMFWTLAMLVGVTMALTGVFVSYISIEGLSEALNFTDELTGGRYLLPVLLAWFTTLLTLFFADQPKSASTPATNTTVTDL